MALEIFYSALHWAKKAERFATSAINSARTAQTAAAQASQASGKIIQLGFDGAIEDGKLVFKHAPSGVETPYQLLDDYEYEVDMLYNSTEELSSDLPMVVKNGADNITFVSALHRSSTEPATVGDMKAVMRYNSDTGYRWLFKAAYNITPAGTKVLLLYPVVASEEAINSKITNCITEIPQDIKLELNNGTLTLKAGSKVYVPNGKNDDGSNKFDVVVISADINGGQGGTLSGVFYLVTPNRGGMNSVLLSNMYSGSTEPTGTTHAVWYDTANNRIGLRHTGSSTFTFGYSFPVCVGTIANNLVTSIDQVFNGFGYIGSTVFALPGVKGLIPDGRNADGSLRNIEFVTSKVLSFTQTNTGTIPFVIRADGVFSAYSNVYDEVTNKNSLGLHCVVGTYTASSGVITSFTPKLPFHAVDYNDAALKQNFQVVSTLPSSPNADTFYFIPE